MEDYKVQKGAKSVAQKKADNSKKSKEKEGKGKKKVLCMVCGCVLTLIVLIGGSLGGYYWYVKVYLAGQAEEYIDSTESDYEKVEQLVEDLEDDVEKNFNSEKSGSMNSNSFEDDVDQAYELADTLATESENALNSLPESKSSTSDLDQDIRDYYAKTKELGLAYKELLAFYKELVPLMEQTDDLANVFYSIEMNSEEDLTKAVSVFEKASQDLNGIIETIRSLEINEDTKATQEMLITCFEGLATYLEDMTAIMVKLEQAVQQQSMDLINEAYDDMEKAESEYSNVDSECTTDNEDDEKRIYDKYIDKINETKDIEDEINDGYDSLKQKYGI